MRNKKIVLSTFSIALILAIVLSFTLVFALPGSGNSVIGVKEIFSETKPYTISESQATDVSFLVSTTGVVDIDNAVIVTDSKGEKVDVRISKMNANRYTVMAPVEGYQGGCTYTIKVADNVALELLPSEKVVNFTIIAENNANVAIKENVVEIGYADVISRRDNSLEINANAKGVEQIGVGTIVIAYAEDDIQNIGDFDQTVLDKECTVAYKVTSFTIVNGVMVMSATRPTMEEVFERVNVDINKKADSTDAIALNNESFAAQMLSSDFVQELTAAGLGKAEIGKPEFKFENGNFILDVTMTFSGLFGGNVEDKLVINFRNVLDIDLVANIGKDYRDKFKLGVDINNTSSATVSLSVSAQGDKVANVQEVFDNVQKKLGGDSNIGKIFTWTLPICSGFNISYDIDFVFRYQFSGNLDAGIVTEVNYDAGIVYANGELQSYSNVSANLVEAGIEVRAVLNLKGGVINYININIMNVIGAGFEVEVGAYSDIYGAAKLAYKNGKAGEIDGWVVGGAMYSDNGFYYDVRLKAHIGINNLISTDISTGIVAGKISIKEFGEKEFMYGLRDASNMTSESNDRETALRLTSKNSKMPTFEIDYWDIVANTHRYEAVNLDDANSDVKVEFVSSKGDDSDIIIDRKTGRIAVKYGVTEVDEYITTTVTQNKMFAHSIVSNKLHVIMESGNPIIDKDEFEFDKIDAAAGFSIYADSCATDISIPFTLNAFGLNDNKFMGIAGNGITADDYTIVDDLESDGVNAKKIILKTKYMITLPQGELTFNILTEANGKNVPVPFYLTVKNELSATTIGSGIERDPHLLFSRDQFLDFAEKSNNGELEGVNFVLANDIDMLGADVKIDKFDGVIDGQNHTIKNFVSTNKAGNVAGLFVINNGVIKNIGFNGTVSVSFDNQDAYVGLIVGENNGIIDNVVASGVVKNYAGMTKIVTINLAGIAGVNNGTISNSTASTTFEGTSHILGVWTKYVAHAITAVNNGEVINAVHTETNIKKVLTIIKL